MSAPAAEPENGRPRSRSIPIHVPTLRRLIDESGLGPDELAAQSISRGVSVSASSLRRALRGEALSKRVREDIATLLGISVEELETGKAPTTPTLERRPEQAPEPSQVAAVTVGDVHRIRESSQRKSGSAWRVAAIAAALGLVGAIGLVASGALPLRPAPSELAGVVVPPGTYTMGSTPERDALHQEDEAPLTEVTISHSLWVKTTEVTQREWDELFDANPSTLQACGGDCPVTEVSWWDAVAWVNKRSELDGYQACYTLLGCVGEPGEPGPYCDSATFRGVHCDGYRLPTEAEWEYFARAGTTTVLYNGELGWRGRNWADGLDPIAWYGGNSKADYDNTADCSGWTEMQIPAQRCGVHPVALKKPNAWGIYDVLGNAAEWMTDAWIERLPGGSVTDPVELVGGESNSVHYRALRGGGWAWNARDVRTSNRHGERGSTRQRNYGFRPVRTVRAAPEAPAAGASAP